MLAPGTTMTAPAKHTNLVDEIAMLHWKIFEVQN
jgi:hypothetical protein